MPELENGVINEDFINAIIKNLYMTGYFSDVKVNIDQNKLQIIVEEFPIISEVLFTGNDILDKEVLLSITNIKSRDIFNEQNINQAIENIRFEYQKIGRYLSIVKIK